jgi:hypothetical protein
MERKAAYVERVNKNNMPISEVQIYVSANLEVMCFVRRFALSIIMCQRWNGTLLSAVLQDDRIIM